MYSRLRGNDKHEVFGEETNMAKATANAMVAQSGGPTSVINSSICGVIQEAKHSKKISRVLAANNGILGVLKEELFDVSAEKTSAIEALKRTPAAAMGSCRYKMKSLDQAKSDFDRVLDVFKAHEIRYFFLRGRQRLNGYG
jgi:6-phosphofructokinase 1